MQIFRYVEEGSINWLWIAGTNPAVSMPTLLRIREILHLNVGKRIRENDPWHWFVSVDVESLDKLAIAQDDPHYFKYLREVIESSVDQSQVLTFEMEPRKDVKYS